MGTATEVRPAVTGTRDTVAAQPPAVCGVGLSGLHLEPSVTTVREVRVHLQPLQPMKIAGRY